MDDETRKRLDEAYKAAGERNDTESVLAFVAEVINAHPNSYEPYSIRGSIYLDLGNYAKAIDDFSKVIEMKGDESSAFSGRGLAYFHMNMREAAIDDLTKAIELTPDFADTYYKRGCLFLDAGNHSAALEDFTKTIELDPQHAHAYGNRGNVFDMIGDIARAIDDFDKVISIDPSDVNAYFNRGNERTKLSQFNEAIDDYSKVLELNPEQDGALVRRADAYFNVNNQTNALADYSAIIERESILSEYALNRRAEIYDVLKKKDLAKADRQRAKQEQKLFQTLMRQAASDEQLLAMIRNHQTAMDVPRKVDHMFICPSKHAKSLVENLKELGMEIDAPTKHWFKVTIESHEEIAPNEMPKRTAQLVRLASKFDASYDGWGTQLD